MGRAIGIDVGGTKIVGLLVDEGGAVLERVERDTPPDDADATVEELRRLAADLDDGAEALGLGMAGMLDFERGVILSSPNLPWANGLPIRDRIAALVDLPCLVDNDANVAAWGEFRFGAARRYERAMLMVTVGTGIGGGIIADGRLYRGAHGFAGEIGHIIVEPDGPRCGCGNRGCWEQVASGRALDRLGAAAAARDRTIEIARLAGGNPVTGRYVADAARAGDAIAVGIFEEVGRRLGEGIAGLVNVLDTEAVVVGGGVAEEGDLILDPARRAFLDAVEASGDRPEVPILQAALGNDAGAIGAADLALEASR
ncbi:MAG TPA: ROK family protein [Actinomycetota bacterium]|nr:ROK family protein [Actinomycetota bacterium]